MNQLNRLGVPKRFSRDWAPADVQYLKDNFRKLGWKECAKHLKRTKGSVLGKANELKLSGRWVLVYDNYPKDAD